MIKKGIYLLVVFILLTTAFVFAGCKEEEDTGLNVGFEGNLYGDPSPSDYCAYRSDVSEFDINDVTLEFFYGGIFSESIEYERSNIRNIGKVKLYFFAPALCENSECATQYDYQYGGRKCVNLLCEDSRYFIKESQKDYTSEAHRWKGRLYEDGEGETITIPKELFVGERGLIEFMVFGKDENHREYPDNEYELISGKIIHYKIYGYKVVLSGEEIK